MTSSRNLGLTHSLPNTFGKFFLRQPKLGTAFLNELAQCRDHVALPFSTHLKMTFL